MPDFEHMIQLYLCLYHVSGRYPCKRMIEAVGRFYIRLIWELSAHYLSIVAFLDNIIILVLIFVGVEQIIKD